MLSCVPQLAAAQVDTAMHTDSAARITREIPPVVVSAYGYSRTLRQTPASVIAIDAAQLGRYSNTTPLQAINAMPGVRMEERSPGSYRLNVRGTALRSPFGVRNTKIYYNDIPLTDPSGFSYFSQIGFFNIASLQLIKGPGSSLYGAGTGGVMHINSLNADTVTGGRAFYEMGSYGLVTTASEARLCGPGGSRQVIRMQRVNSSGYRDRSEMTRTGLSWDGIITQRGKTEIRTTFLYNELNYGTPGALTLAEYQADPRMARPAANGVPGAIESRAQVLQRNLLAGFTTMYQLGPALRNTTTLYTSYTTLKNPTIRNYSRTIEPHSGGRTTFSYTPAVKEGRLQVLAGSEVQYGNVFARTYTNVDGNAGILQSDDETGNYQYSGFVQATWGFRRWMPEVGISVTRYGTTIERFSAPAFSGARDHDINVSPRMAVSYNVTRQYYAYASAAKGFSPPTSAELLPTGSSMNMALRPEEGWNYELGSKGNISPRFSYDVGVFYFGLMNAIVLRKTLAGGDEYINAGATKQIGVEAMINYRSRNDGAHMIWLNDSWLSYTGYDMRYKDLVQVATDLSGNRLPGVAPHTVAAGIDLASRQGFVLALTYFFSDRLPLNDMNTTYADAYHILDTRLSYQEDIGRVSGRVFIGANNLLDQRYSLGNDINAAGGRYYNAAPGINFYAGLVAEYHR
ncbi:TonB-dependent receptor [Nemorincola caseinilytica]|uniref:TonB-dependent receptor n=1 Tax=Nemorincola caseinilytica TaxID=2054315 RepID=A0ABP8N678_9BACT